MEIIIGGMCQGKLNYVLEQTELTMAEVCDGREIAITEIPQQKIWNHFHSYIRRLLEQGQEVDQLVEQIIQLNKTCYLICDEIGCGVVPMEPFERAYREKVGRIMCQLTRRANKVTRVQCGIGTVIKDEK